MLEVLDGAPIQPGIIVVVEDGKVLQKHSYEITRSEQKVRLDTMAPMKEGSI